MSYSSKSIRDIVIEDINQKMFLPAIQREYVWDTKMVEKLFDSIMNDMPISSFLLWKIEEKNKKDWVSYKFIENFDSQSPHNEEANLSGINKDIYLVLDGQQRLTSLYIGLKGTFSYFYYKVKKTKLYLNLFYLKPNEDDPEKLKYQFEFHEIPPKCDKDNYWYPVGEILERDDPEDSKSDVEDKIMECNDQKSNDAKKLIGRLHNRIHTQKLINYYEEKAQDYDKVVEVFIRANTGGKKLDYSDILLSTATAKWKGLNAREELHEFTDTINKIGNGYSFGKDFVLKGSLFLTEGVDIKYKVKNFTQNNLEKIEENWEEIKQYIEQTIHLIAKLGINDKNVVSHNALLPIAFYLRKLQKKKYYLSTNKNDVENQIIIQNWLISILKNVFGASSDTKLKNVRDAILSINDYSKFPSDIIMEKLKIDVNYTKDEVEHLVNTTKYRTKYSFLILSLLYPNRDWKDNVYNEDHIFPQSEFTTAKLKKRGYNADKIEKYKSSYNNLPNLMLLTDYENKKKSSKNFKDWISNRDNNFKDRHLIPDMSDYSFDNFLEFIEERKKLIKSKL